MNEIGAAFSLVFLVWFIRIQASNAIDAFLGRLYG